MKYIICYNKSDVKKMIDWFEENYINSRDSIINMVGQASIEHACSINSLYESCKVIKTHDTKKYSLKIHIQWLTKLADVGVEGRNAGEKLRNYLLSDGNVGKELLPIKYILER